MYDRLVDLQRQRNVLVPRQTGSVTRARAADPLSTTPEWISMSQRGWDIPFDESLSALLDGEEYVCPVCGIELSEANFETPAEHYYCPSCSTRQLPSLVITRDEPPVASAL
jgi:DNA-directed RNA polymerase subunit RPC12/RpoP